jgi:cytochrome c peroxidase
MPQFAMLAYTNTKFLGVFCVVVLHVAMIWGCRNRCVGGKETPSERAKVVLGQHLFYDTRLSANNTKACATCHAPQFAFSDGYRRSSGIYADETKHNSPSLLQVAGRRSLNWADPYLHSLEVQMLRPLFGTSPTEMGAKSKEAIIYRRLATDSLYSQLFAKAYPKQSNPIHFTHIRQCIALFLSTLKSCNSPYDAYQRSLDTTHFGFLAQRGAQLFFSDRLGCGTCHNGTNLDTPTRGDFFANIGLYNCDNMNTYPSNDLGIAEVTHRKGDNGKFRIPSLRNVAITAPYFHDGTSETLYEVLQTYENGGRNIIYGNCVGNGQLNVLKDARLRQFSLTSAERQQIVAFLHALTDTSYLQNTSFNNPFGTQ